MKLSGSAELVMELEVFWPRNVIDINPNGKSIPFLFSDSQVFNNTGVALDKNGIPLGGIFYKLYLPKGGFLDINQCKKGSVPYFVGTKLYVLDDKFRLIAPIEYFNLYSDNTCSKVNVRNSNMSIEDEGVYYIAVTGLSTNVNSVSYHTVYGTITTSINVGDKRTIIDLGEMNSAFEFSETVNTSNTTNSNATYLTNEIYYKLHVSHGMKLDVDNCNSDVKDTKISIYRGSSGNKDFYLSTTSEDFDKIECLGSKSSHLSVEAKDTYLLICVEGISENGKIAVNIKGTPNGRYYGSPNLNYINTRTYLTENSNKFMENIQYFDELGNLEEEVQVSATPSNEDLVSYIEYDNIGRQSKIWQPIVVPFNGGSRASLNKVESNSRLLYDDEKAYI